jgi:nucleolar MIF4G domain-containing protein 1
MIETLTTLKNNRLKSTAASSAITLEATIRMKKLLGGLNTRNLRATEPLRASLEDIKSTETKGKWWLVGASWAGNNSNDNNASSSNTSPSEAAPLTAYDADSDAETALPDLQALARQHRMNTDIRRAIFTTLLSSTDYADAHARLFKLHLKRSQEREIPRVLLHCAAAEGSYNPYYSLIARKLCASHALRMTFQFTLWEYFRRFGEDDGSGEGPPQDDDDDDDDDEGEGGGENGSWSTPRSLRKVVNLARVYAALVVGGCLGVDILKTLNWGYLQPATRSFLEVFFTDVFTEARAETKPLAALFGAAKVAENVNLVRGVAYFLRKKVASGGVAVGQEQKAYVRSGVKVAVGMLEDVLKG